MAGQEREAGLESIVTIGTTADSSREAVAIARDNPPVSTTVGIQPNYVSQAQPDDWQTIEELAPPKVVAIGETGLDRCSRAPFNLQQTIFVRHIDTGGAAEIAVRRPLPRSGGADILASLANGIWGPASRGGDALVFRATSERPLPGR